MRFSLCTYGKALRHSFDQFHDRKAAHILSAFASDSGLVLAHLDCDDKSNEIPAVQSLLGALGLDRALITVDAMHCQKNLRPGRRPADRPGQAQPARPAPRDRAHLPGAGPARP